MSGLKELKNRLRSVSETKKITTAMKLVAGAKFRRAQGVFMASKPYADGLAAMFGALQAYAARADLPLPGIHGGSEGARCAYVVFSSDRGLCGGFNGQVLRYALREMRSTLDEGKDLSIVCFGAKAAGFFKRVLPQYVRVAICSVPPSCQELMDFLDQHAREIYAVLLDAGLANTVLVYNRFDSPIKQTAVKESFVPQGHGKSAPSQGLLWGIEPASQAYCLSFLQDFIKSRLMMTLLESSAGEQGARMFAMDNATRNADEMITHLRLRYNRTRQAIITTELTEIISGAEAIA